MQHPYTEAEIDAVVKVMREACGQTQGKYMVEFEQAFCAFTGAKHAFAVNNCTSALKMAAIFCHIQPGDEVIIPAYTFCASAIPFGDLGAKIVWADINPDTWTIDPDDIARKITPKTKAVVCVHLLGMPCDMKKIVPIARAHGLKVVEDCAQALDCRIDGQHVGTFGDFGCFSFHSAKTMTTLGEGGMFVCADDADAAAAPGIRHNGCCAYPADRERYWSPAMSCVDSFLDDRWPQNFCIGEAQCALGTEELKSVIANNNTLIEQDRKIREKLAGLPEISFSRCPENGRYVVHQYIMHYDGSACGKTRDDLLDLMTKKYGIRCIVQYYPLYRYPLFQRKGCGEFDCPVLDKWWDGSFSFPWWCGMDDTVIDTLCSSLISAVEELRG
jgi:perosamine synthetase